MDEALCPGEIAAGALANSTKRWWKLAETCAVILGECGSGAAKSVFMRISNPHGTSFGRPVE